MKITGLGAAKNGIWRGVHTSFGHRAGGRTHTTFPWDKIARPDMEGIVNFPLYGSSNSKKKIDGRRYQFESMAKNCDNDQYITLGTKGGTYGLNFIKSLEKKVTNKKRIPIQRSAVNKALNLILNFLK